MAQPMAKPLQAEPYATDADRWEAVIHRDKAADGVFYYSVRTTGVYCRPSCAARLARRENVAFHTSPDAAKRAGFRPCKRCRPDDDTSAHAAAIARACRVIEQAEEPPKLDDLAAEAGLSRFHFHRVFKAMTGLTPARYAAAHRAGKLRDGLARASSVTEAIYDAGFNSSSRFYEGSKSVLGMTPTRYRAGGDGIAIRYAISQCWLGAILVAATEAGICAIMMDDDPKVLEQALKDRFKKAVFTPGDKDFDGWVAKVVSHVDTPRIGLDLPLDLRGTLFQQRVWRALREIPPGETTTYAELAKRIGAPNAVRAVGHACGQNPVAVAVPCHRAVRSDGSLAGYRWGLERKRKLIDREAS